NQPAPALVLPGAAFHWWSEGVGSTEHAVIMKFASGQGSDSQWFDWKPGFYQETIRVEWEKDTMEAVIPADLARALIRKGYARPMTDDETRAHRKRLGKLAGTPAIIVA